MNRLERTQQLRSKFPFNEIASEIDQLQGWSKMTRGRMATMSYQVYDPLGWSFMH